MIKILIDTCVWLDLVKDTRSTPMVGALEDLIKSGSITLLAPEITIAEFSRNKERVLNSGQQSLKTHIRLVRAAVNRFAEDDYKERTLEALTEIDRKALLDDGDAVGLVERIENLMANAVNIPSDDEIFRGVNERALSGAAPYHRNKNSIGDAIIIETYSKVLRESEAGDTCAFVTHNFHDFSDHKKDNRKPHPDFAVLFDAANSGYWLSLADLLKEIDPDLVANHDLEFEGWGESRRVSEILDAEHLLFRQVWYNRHWNLRSRIEKGEHFVVPEAEYSTNPYRADQILDTVWNGALAAAKRTEDEVGEENLGPWDDFEWGMLNGKLSALRWIMGDEWDMLDT